MTLHFVTPLLHALASAAVAASSCTTIYEWSTSGIIDGKDFAGTVFYGADQHVAVFDTPLYADPSVADAPVIGRLMGQFWPHAASDTNMDDENNSQQVLNSGSWNFNFFADGRKGTKSSWLSANLGFGPNNSSANTPNVIIGGTNEWSGFIGTVDHEAINSDPFVIKYTICPTEPLATYLKECNDIYTWDASEPSIVGNYSFAGDVARGSDDHLGVLDNPVFSSLDTARNRTATGLKGRNLGVYFTTALQTNVASFNFQLFDSSSNIGNNWIATSFGFSFHSGLGEFTAKEQPNVILGGSGKAAGIAGTIEDTVVEFLYSPDGQLAEINNYIICPADDPLPNPIVLSGCTEIYEWSADKPISLGAYNFSGSSIIGEDGHLGLFDTPFFFSPDVKNSQVAGRVMGTFFPNSRGTATGRWNFHFFGADNNETPTGWLSGNLGFNEEDNLDVITGGSGDWNNFIGRSRATQVRSDPLVFLWTICPEGLEFPDAPSPTEDSEEPYSATSGGFTNQNTVFILPVLFGMNFVLVRG